MKKVLAALAFSTALSGSFVTYAADLPVVYKGRPAEAPGQFRIWVEGGAIWTGGDPVSQAYNLTDFTRANPIFGGGAAQAQALAGPIGSSDGTIGGIFALSPKIGWEAATGFDYKFAGSPWHVSGQFRYGEGGKTSGTASSAGSFDPSTDIFFGEKCPCLLGGSQTVAASYRERHWLTDLALGYDVAGHGPTAMQVKGGFRISEFVAQANTSDRSFAFFNFLPRPFIGDTVVGSFSVNSLTTQDIRNSFLGAGPLIGLEGSVPFAGAWSFDYKGNLAVLFGTQKSVSTEKNITTVSPAFALGGASSFIGTDTAARFATMLSGDIQVGVSYWFTQNFKVGVSYRIDALVAVQNQERANVDLLIPNRYTHGPRLTLTGQF